MAVFHAMILNHLLTLQRDSVIEDMIIPPPSQKYLRKGYRAITETPDGMVKRSCDPFIHVML